VARETLTVVDNRTGRTYETPIQHRSIRAADLRQIRTDDQDLGLLSYDPGFVNTAACESRITTIDGERGVLLYRGYPIEQLAAQASFMETAYLLLEGTLPTAAQLAAWSLNITTHTILHENVKKFMAGFRYDAHPMGMLLSTVGALSTFYPGARDILDPASRRSQAFRLIAKVSTIAAFCYRHTMGLPYVYPDNDLTYTGNFLSMMFKMTETQYRADPVLERALEVLFILHADHEQTCSTSAMRTVGSAHADPFTAVAAAMGALYGPRHGGANEAVLRQFLEIGRVERVAGFVRRVKSGESRLVGFGHPVYRSYDPRARIIQALAPQVCAATRRDPLLDVALELEKIALQDEYFVRRKLYPNVDFYSGLVYRALGFPSAMFPVLFAIPRTVGWLAQWEEMLLDPEIEIVRPRQLYHGPAPRDFVPLKDRA